MIITLSFCWETITETGLLKRHSARADMAARNRARREKVKSGTIPSAQTTVQAQCWMPIIGVAAIGDTLRAVPRTTAVLPILGTC